MTKQEYADKFDDIKSIHIRIEKILQAIALKTSADVCSGCSDFCCKLIYCKESVESRFLRDIIGKNLVLFDKANGWLREDGCSLQYGRPLVCYEYFCDRFKGNGNVKDLKLYGALFRKIYLKAYGKQHMLALKDLKHISDYRLDKMLNDLKDLEQKAQNTLNSVL